MHDDFTSTYLNNPFACAPHPPQEDILSIEFKQCLNFSPEHGFTTILVTFSTNLTFLYPWLSFICGVLTQVSSLPYVPLGTPPLTVSPINLYRFIKDFSPFITNKEETYARGCIELGGWHNHGQSYNMLFTYAEELRKRNARTLVKKQLDRPSLNVNPTSKRFFVCFSAMNEGF